MSKDRPHRYQVVTSRYLTVIKEHLKSDSFISNLYYVYTLALKILITRSFKHTFWSSLKTDLPELFFEVMIFFTNISCNYNTKIPQAKHLNQLLIV